MAMPSPGYASKWRKSKKVVPSCTAFMEEVAALRSKLLQLSDIPGQQVNEHLSMIVGAYHAETRAEHYTTKSQSGRIDYIQKLIFQRLRCRFRFLFCPQNYVDQSASNVSRG
ncbi:hypothetical protein TELCIR_08606, partial [Teladorsagia circumcincta]